LAAKKTAAAKQTTSSTSTSSSSSSGAAVGDVISYQLDDDSPTVTGLVVGKIAGGSARDAALEVVALPESTVVPLDAVKG
jgi:hypothetical protein